MKFNALVVAAMVITSVNAAGEGGFLSCFGLSCRSGKSKDPEPEANPICNSIKAELHTLWIDISVLNREFREQMPSFYGLMMMEKDAKGMHERGKRGKKDKKGHLKAKMIQDWLKSHPEAIPDLQKIKAKSIGFKAEYNDIWKRFDKNKCRARRFERLSSKEMTQMGYFPNWKDAKGRNILGDQ
ncbi:hypothetical protein BASA62_005339 [Batrachochytrium salamandrivorans]|nr:hypothetical protein BASA62_005339 [Batrachochytrium salamandrivorans]